MKRFVFVSLILAACSSGEGERPDDGNDPQPGDAYLTIVGDTNVFLENGDVTQVTVKYHDGQGNPLAGAVAFEISGDAVGGALGAASDVTDGQGHAQVAITAGAQGEAFFNVYASAEYAEPVFWRVAVSQGQLPLQLDGSYAIDSQFDLATGLPGDAGEIVNSFIEMTDDPTDPATYILDQLIEKLDSDFMKDAINATRPALDGYLNDLIRDNAPGFVTSILDIGNDFGEVARGFGMKSQLDVISDPTDTSMFAKHTVTGFNWTVDDVVYEYSAADIGLDEIYAENVGMALDGNTVTIAQHTLAIPYGRLVLFALDNVLIPMIDPFAGSLSELLLANVDCAAIGQRIYDEVGFGSPGTFEAACIMGIEALAESVENELLDLDGAGTSFVLYGDAHADDLGGDSVVDRLANGQWEGTFNVGGLSSALSRPNQRFVGERMSGTP